MNYHLIKKTPTKVNASKSNLDPKEQDKNPKYYRETLKYGPVKIFVLMIILKVSASLCCNQMKFWFRGGEQFSGPRTDGRDLITRLERKWEPKHLHTKLKIS